MGRAAPTVKIRKSHITLSENQKGKENCGGPGVNWKIILKCIVGR
jgi:hypothetical protein